VRDSTMDFTLTGMQEIWREVLLEGGARARRR
jgi:hypothetical protein